MCDTVASLFVHGSNNNVNDVGKCTTGWKLFSQQGNQLYCFGQITGDINNLYSSVTLDLAKNEDCERLCYL